MKAKRILLMVVMTFFLLSVDTGDVKAADIIHSGRSGALDWTIDSEGCFVLSGSGDYEVIYREDIYGEVSESEFDFAWTPYVDEIKTARVSATNITNMNCLFKDCSNLLSVSFEGADTSKVTDMSGLFLGCSKLENVDLGNLNTSNVTLMTGMFNGCTNLRKVDLKGFDTNKVESMGSMFASCENLEELDISDFDTAGVYDMGDMFAGCKKLRSVDVRNFNTSRVVIIAEMFYDCSSLVTLDLSNFDLSYISQGIAGMFDGCDNLVRLYTPYNLAEDWEGEAELPVNPKGKWVDAKGDTYMSLPVNLSESILLTVEGSSVKGDISDDGEVNITDLMMCLYQVSGRSALTGNGLTAADIDGNGKVELTDLMRILYFVSGRNSTL